MGRMTVGIMDMAENMPIKSVDLLLSKTTKDNAKFMATPPIQLIIVPKVIIVKFSASKYHFPSLKEVYHDFNMKKDTVL